MMIGEIRTRRCSAWAWGVWALLLLQTPLRSADTIVRAAKVHLGNGKTLSPGAVHVRDGKIVAVAEKVDGIDGARIVELSSGVLTPGFIDAHTSLGVAGGSSEITVEIAPKYKAYKAIDWYSREFDEARMSGVTSAAVFPGQHTIIGGDVAVVKTVGADLSSRVVVPSVGLAAVFGEGPTARNSARSRPESIFVRQPTNRMGVVWMVRATFQKAKRDEDPDYQDVLKGSKPLLAEAHVEPDIDAVLRLADEFKFKPIIFGASEAFQAAEALAKAKIPVVIDGIGTSFSPGPERSDPFWNHAGVLNKAGVTFAIGGGEILDKARFAVRYGLDRETALAAITSKPAEILGVSNRMGQIKVGLDADLVAFDGDPMEWSTRILWTAVGGDIPNTTPQQGPK
jgi:imidazolonepropionase-like amidohydrolase